LPRMTELTAKVIAATIESSFVQTRPFLKERLDQIGVRALDLFKANGLQPEHIGLRTVDVLFGYELNFSLFGGSATFQLSGARLILSFKNIVTRDALQTAAETAGRAHSMFEKTDFLEHAIAVVAHRSFRNEQQRKNATASMEDPARQIEFLGRLAHFRIPEWSDAIHLEIDRSIFFPPGLFLSWNTVRRGQVDVEALTQAAKAFEITANRFDFSVVVP
jgi:hypothetical protein